MRNENAVTTPLSLLTVHEGEALQQAATRTLVLRQVVVPCLRRR